MKSFNPHINVQPLPNNTAYLTARIVCSDKRVKYSLGLPAIDAHPKTGHWDFKTKKLRKSANVEWRRRLEEVIGWMNEFVEGKEEVLSVDLINHLRKLDGKEVVPVGPVADIKPQIYKDIKNLIKDATNGDLLNPRNGNKYGEGTMICWTKTMNKLEKHLPNLSYDYTMTDYNNFVKALQKDGKRKNYIGALVKDWRTFMKFTQKKGLHNNMTYMHPDFKQHREEPNKEFLTEKHIELLMNLELTGTQKIIRDRFVFNTGCGLRISDMETFEQEATIADGIATMVNQKTKKKVSFPLPPIYFKLIEEYGGNLPKQYHRNIVNREIKKIAKDAGLIQAVHVVTTKGGKEVTETKAFWQVITNHTARRSFVSNELEFEDSLTVGSMAGMSPKTVKLYDKRKSEDIAAQVLRRRMERQSA